MRKGLLYIISIGLMAGMAGTLYFLFLMLGVPFVVTVPVIGVSLLLFAKYLLLPNVEPDGKEDPLSWVAWCIFVAGLVVFLYRSYAVGEQYGGWDAWCIWNYHAKCLVYPAYWEKIFLFTMCHPDYPMLVPGFIAFFARLTSLSNVETISFIFSYSITLFIPVLLFVTCVRKNVLVAGAAFFALVLNESYIREGVSLYADTTLAFFFLSAIVCLGHAQTSYKWIVMTGACLGCCAWTKNEGVVLAGIFFIFNFRTLMLKGNYKYLLAGIVVPMVTFVVFKTCYATKNGLVSEITSERFMQLVDSTRYDLIYKSLSDNINDRFAYIKYTVVLYIIVCVLWLKWPDRQFMMVISCFAAYFMVYVLTNVTLEWHLNTSYNRLLHQLMPALLYVIAVRVASVLQQLRYSLS